jgi:signal peptidase II
MNLTLKKGYLAAVVILVVLLIDQALKVYIKTHFEYNEDVTMLGLDWARLHFVENEGMAFGITLDWKYGKLLLSLFRILMVAGLFWYIRMLIQSGISTGFVVSVALITAGAIGNIIDSAIYGMIFTESPYHGGLATLTSFGQGYGQDMMMNGFMHGKVVDMFYFPMKWIHWPDWVPMIGGEEWLFFSPIFNVADAAITCGVLSIFLFQRHFFKQESQQTMPPTHNTEAHDADLALGADSSPASDDDSNEPEASSPVYPDPEGEKNSDTKNL